MKTVLLPSGRTCTPRKLRSVYKTLREFMAYDEIYKVASRISPDEGPRKLWERNPFIVSSVYPADLAEYCPLKHPFRA